MKKTGIIKLILTIAGVAAILAVTVYFVMGALSPKGIEEHAKAALSDGEYEEAIDIYKKSDNNEAIAEAYFKSEEWEKSRKIFETLPENENVIGRLCDIYAIQKDTAGLQNTINKYKDTKYRKAVERYLVSAPQFSLKEGKYYEEQKIEITAKGDVYYTIDGSIPTKDSNKYSAPITLPEGTSRLIAIAISPLEIESGLTEAMYTFKLSPPSVPGISLRGGVYVGEQIVELNNSDSDSKIYYTIDGSIPTVNSSEYIRPLKIMSGYVNLKAIAVDPVGRESKISENKYYVMNAKIVK